LRYETDLIGLTNFASSGIVPTRVRRASVPGSNLPAEVWEADADVQDRLIKLAIRNHYGEWKGYVPAFGAIVSYTFIVMAGYVVDFGLPYDVIGERTGPMRSMQYNDLARPPWAPSAATLG
jgi:hypothetical protein